MSQARSTPRRPLPRTAALIALGAVGVHQLRYLLAYGSGAGHQLGIQGHGYFEQALPVLAGFALATIAAGLIRVAAGRRGPSVATSLPRSAAALALAMAAVFCVQETIEGALFAGHAAGLAGPFAGGGWLALPLAAVFGMAAALVERAILGVERIAARVATGRRRLRPRRIHRLPTAPRLLALPALPLAFGLARRPPPPATLLC